jgi:hypothetical protein
MGTMTPLGSIWRTFKTLTLTAACWAAACAPVLAAAPEVEEETGGGGGASWVLSYVLVMLGVALGLVCLLRPSKRRDHAHSELFGD